LKEGILNFKPVELCALNKIYYINNKYISFFVKVLLIHIERERERERERESKISFFL